MPTKSYPARPVKLAGRSRQEDNVHWHDPWPSARPAEGCSTSFPGCRACVNILELPMEDTGSDGVLERFGKRVQRCYGCLIAFHLRDMYLSDDVTYYCENCRDESMFHFDQFSKLLDVSKLREASDDEEDHHH